MKFQYILLPVLLFLISCTPGIKRIDETRSPDIRVLLSSISSKDSIEFKGIYKLHSEEAEYEFGTANNLLYIVPSEEGLLLYNQNRYLEYRNSSVVRFNASDHDSHFLYRGREYNGDLYFLISEDSPVYLINKLALEEYLRGVVPAEIPCNDMANYEAVKAQTICARTYSLNKMEKLRDKDFDVFADVRDQVYSGVLSYHPAADKAIQETKGIILTYNNQPATIYYHSTCGGKLEPVENVFGNIIMPYLPQGTDAVSDIFSCSASPRFRWVENRTFSQLDSSFFQYYNKSNLINVPPVTDTLNLQMGINVLERTSTGRVTKLAINYADTSVVLEDSNIRRFLGWPLGTSLNSNLFYISQSNDSTLTFHGGGYGHGVGMCQYGALNMSRKGFRYYHILSKYFPGTLLSKGY